MIVIVIYYLGNLLAVCNAGLMESTNLEGRLVKEELNLLRENVREIELDLHHVKKQLNLTQEVETTIQEKNKERLESMNANMTRTTQLREGAWKVAKTACHCVCYISKAVVGGVKACYGKMRSMCCKKTTIKPEDS
ncbi:uncharacterized protein LOC128985367 [Macrosteles quadrilineatus]|uniref:uncharacterized protein LOC128985367 n=1 Tax=Macrosteles quadrilineatus TaxID=74068 RepID=UPI0023E12F04|nr:uncharacterized protein LOC128985367 [Macrosteles quadrilineatus]